MLKVDAQQKEIIAKLREHGIDVFRDDQYRGRLIITSGDGVNAHCSLISDVNSVTSLYSGDNDLCDDGIAKLCTLGTLRRMTLVLDKVTAKGVRRIANLTELRDLALGGSFPVVAAAKAISTLPKLKILYLVDVGLTKTGLAHLGKCPALEELHISGNPVSHGFDVLAACEFLKELDIERVPITQTGAKEIGTLRNVERLSLCFCPVTDTMMSEISRMEQLKELYVEPSKVTSKSVALLTRLRNLEELDWPSQAIGEEQLQQFRSMRNLRKINFRGTLKVPDDLKVPDELLRKLREMRPDLSVTQL